MECLVLGTAESLSALRCLASGALYPELGLDAIVIGSPAVWDRQRKVATTASVHVAGNRLTHDGLWLVRLRRGWGVRGRLGRLLRVHW